ncbi:uncharacterized protein LOC110618465 [Manihot esculenta]|uniref:Hemerythrin-like domain-containing protein n=1 Tax=Manihot esculenta TaxID=3983 RepID=A0A2C9VJT8_MANES|nr:uncharacterized protein LOC110618465 [Manihot esculenta]XP_043813944.1 uncharacterized protein LOC110618465 [Manihot esculenta]OAY45734.1 hypothetical protein MANES_07G086900v8 [Manihot esculenta]
MGNCLNHSKKSNAEIAPFDFIKSTTAIKLYGSPTAACTAYIRFALLYKTLSLDFVPTTDTPDSQLVLQIGSKTVSGSRETLLRFIDAKLPQPPLMLPEIEGFGETTPWIMRAVVLQHRSMRWHLERLVNWGEDLTTRGGRKTVDPAMGSPRMEIRKFSKSYSQLLEIMLEHAQMEERVVFPILEMADRGICRAANEEHARDLPIMNGIKEDIKSIGVLDTGSPDYREALCNLSTRLKSLLEHCKEHFEEEEKDLLPLMEAVELSKEQQLKVLEQCFDLMHGTDSHLFNFLIEGLLPWEAMHYLDLILTCKDEEKAASMLCSIIE